jgi:hypothetical protein
MAYLKSRLAIGGLAAVKLNATSVSDEFVEIIGDKYYLCVDIKINKKDGTLCVEMLDMSQCRLIDHS